MRKHDKQITRLMWALQGPIIVWPQYGDMPMSKDVSHQITIQRLGLVAKEAKRASDAETMWYLSTASFTAPMPRHWAHIYQHLTTKYLDLQGRPVPEDIRTDLLDTDEERHLNRLQEWLYKKSLEATKQKLKQCH